MINTLKNVFSVLVLSALTTTAYAGINVGVDSDYIFRGVSQTDGGKSAWAGADWSHDSGIYAGAWVGQVDYSDGSDLETDLFVGWAGNLGSLGIDVSYVDYSYNGNDSLDGSEIWLSGSLGDMSALYVLGQDGYEDYAEFGYALPGGINLSYGMWDNIGDHVKLSRDFDLPVWGLGASVSFVDFTADSNSGLLDEDSIVFGLSKSF